MRSAWKRILAAIYAIGRQLDCIPPETESAEWISERSGQCLLLDGMLEQDESSDRTVISSFRRVTLMIPSVTLRNDFIPQFRIIREE